MTLGAKLADFGGFQMPIEYAGSGGGVLSEHKAVREGVGVFDVSHLGKVAVTGPGAAALINRTLTNDLDRIRPGQAQYTFCCDEHGGVVDDLIVYLNADDDLFLVPNAANTAEVVRRLRAAAPNDVIVSDRHETYGVIAVQGPSSTRLLSLLDLPTELDYMAFARSQYAGIPLTVCRTGYTGERGYELVTGWDQTAGVWDALLERGVDLGARPCGLGARDTLRLEMGYPLHGQDLSVQTSPLQARSAWAIGWQKPEFWGKAALEREKAAGPERLLWGLRAADRGIPRPQMRVLGAGGTPVGEVTSGTFSPTLRCGIGLALLDTASALGEGDTVTVDVRGRKSTMVVMRPPFVESHVR